MLLPGSFRNLSHNAHSTKSHPNNANNSSNNNNNAQNSSSKTISNMRNKRIVVMLSLLTTSFAISTLPSSLFYTFFRPILNDKPYKSLFSMSFILLRHLSHAFNFIIYFTSSSIIKQQLNEIFNGMNLRNKSPVWFCESFKCCFQCCLITSDPMHANGGGGGGGGSGRKSSENNRPQTTCENKNSSESVEFMKPKTAAAVKLTISRAKSPSSLKSGMNEIENKESFNLLRSHAGKAVNEEARDCNRRKASYKRKIKNLHSHSLLSLSTVSSLSDLRSYYSVSQNYAVADTKRMPVRNIIRLNKSCGSENDQNEIEILVQE